LEAALSTPTINQIYQHVSVRSYKQDPVPRALIQEIIAASQRASTSSNMQTWTVVAVHDESKRVRLMELCGNQDHILQAPWFLTWCADLSRLNRICQLLGYECETAYVENFIISSMDAAIAMQTAALAAESIGLGMCYIGAVRNNPQEVIKLLDLPKLVFPVCGMTLGWPAESPFKKPRLPLEAILHWESYGVEEEEALLCRYDEEMYDTGIYGNRIVPVPDSAGETRKFSWMERSARKGRRPLRTHLRQALKDQGFELR
jgi:FMN reductase (NADPH)